jgi:hypothetical protein
MSGRIVNDSGEIRGVPQNGHFKPSRTNVSRMMESFTKRLQHGMDTASRNKVWLSSHFSSAGAVDNSILAALTASFAAAIALLATSDVSKI